MGPDWDKAGQCAARLSETRRSTSPRENRGSGTCVGVARRYGIWNPPSSWDPAMQRRRCRGPRLCTIRHGLRLVEPSWEKARLRSDVPRLRWALTTSCTAWAGSVVRIANPFWIQCQVPATWVRLRTSMVSPARYRLLEADFARLLMSPARYSYVASLYRLLGRALLGTFQVLGHSV
ncbi:hypothetical protein VTK73DRAFT_5503 [Phialemonium thermophilum]|uniref:Uncharacterized protein n=1 Tax=Phialemonium thermophilum TaxID=223376 RepID=A0ABR3V1Y3_9PEZI